MHPVVNHLIQLQELTLIREEQKVTKNAPHRLDELDKSIKSMKGQLPKDVAVMFEKLNKKDHNVIVPIPAGTCSVCGMGLPISLVQAVKLARDVHSCPNCARMLYFPESAPRRTSKPSRRMAPKKPGISRFSSHTLMIPKLEADDKEGIIRELAHKMETEGFVDKGKKLVEPALRREAIVSTATTHGLAFPHVRGVEGGGLTLALGIHRKGVRFTEDGKLTRIIFFMVIPTAAAAFYLKLLAGLAESFGKADARKALMAAKTEDTLWKALAKLTRATVK
jgi:mannitol/fructose-specific phosphotransferase system IIA component (Ntr-type)